MREKTIITRALPPLLQSEIAALSALADEGPTNVYQIAKKAGKAYSLMFNAIKKLKEFNLVMFVEKKQTSKGTVANNYDLNFLGILSVLRIEILPKNTKEVDYDRIRIIISKYEDWLPLVFGKWSFFQRVGLEETALLRLKAIVATVFANRDLLYGFIAEPLAPAADMRTTATWFFYFLGLIPVGREFQEEWQFRHGADEWLSALKQDKDIQAYFMEELQWCYKRLQSLSNTVARVTKVIGEEHIEKPREG